MSDDSNLPKPIAKVVGEITSIITLITLITAIVGLILLWQGYPQIVSTVVIAVGTLGFWASLLYIRLSKKAVHHSRKHVSSDRHKRNVGYTFSEKIRYWALIGLFIVPIFAASGFGIYSYEANQ